MTLLEKVKTLNVNDKITIIIEGIFGDKIKQKATYVGNIRKDGYMKENGGAWSYNSSHGYNIPCYRIDFRLYKHRKINSSLLGYKILDIKKGW